VSTADARRRHSSAALIQRYLLILARDDVESSLVDSCQLELLCAKFKLCRSDAHLRRRARSRVCMDLRPHAISSSGGEQHVHMLAVMYKDFQTRIDLSRIVIS
jgi:hypothetical protein